MEFSPANKIVQLCLRGMAMEAQNKPEEAGELFMQAWNEAGNDFERFLAAYFVAKPQTGASERLKWLETSLQHALNINNEMVFSAYPTLYTSIGKCYEGLNDFENAKKNHALAISYQGKIFDEGPFYHGTKADLQPGDFLVAGGNSNYQSDLVMNHIYFTALVNGAGLAASLAKGDGAERVYLVEPTGPFENDPNVTDKKFPGNLTRSYRSEAPLKILGEVKDWAKQTPESLREWRQKLAENKGAIIN